MKKSKVVTSLSLIVLASNMANGAIIISNWSISGASLSFDISGTIDAGANIGSSNANALYIGVPGNANWVLKSSTGGTINNNGGVGVADLAITSGNSFFSDSSSGDFIYLEKSSGVWTTGDSVDASVLLTRSASLLSQDALDGAQVTFADMIVTAGFDSTPVPDATTQVGSAVPEPSTTLFASLSALGLLTRRKRRVV